MTFVRGSDERAVLAGLGVDPEDAMLPGDPEFTSTPGITIVRSGDWLVALEDAVYARGIRLDVQLRLSAGTEVVVFYEDTGKGNNQFAHVVDGEVITSVMTTVPPSWGGTQPDRLRSLAEELGMSHADGSPSDSDYDLGGLEPLLLIAEVAVGLSVDEADLNRPLLRVPDPAGNTDPALGARGTSAAAVDSELVRSHVQQLIDRGVSADAIAAHAGVPAPWVGRLLSGQVGPWMAASRARQILGIQAPPQSAP
jgi:hypothetical protein